MGSAAAPYLAAISLGNAPSGPIFLGDGVLEIVDRQRRARMRDHRADYFLAEPFSMCFATQPNSQRRGPRPKGMQADDALQQRSADAAPSCAGSFQQDGGAGHQPVGEEHRHERDGHASGRARASVSRERLIT
jgi:hypothetical protein